MMGKVNLPMRFGNSDGLRLLSLDGGGVKGLTSLYILKRLMYLIEPNDDPYRLPKPCDYFDLIAGTSTGGLIAVMLGRLEMDVQTCIDRYLELSTKVFKRRKRTWGTGIFFYKLIGSPPFSAEKLEKSIMALLGSMNPPLHEKTSFLCDDNSRYVFVCATMQNGHSLRLRSYPSKTEENTNCTIIEAARATSAAPGFFSPIKLGRVGVTLVDGALLNNNPVRELVKEVDAEFPGCSIDCIVSIGTGMVQVNRIKKSLIGLAQNCARIATETEQTRADFEETNCTQGRRFHGKYFRFNVSHGLEDVGLEEWASMEDMWAITVAYMREEKQALTECVRCLKRSPAHQQPKPRPPPPVLVEDRIFEIPAGKMIRYFKGRREHLEKIQDYLSTPVSDAARPRVVVLRGMGGEGKTQLAIRAAYENRYAYRAVFFVDASSITSVEESFRSVSTFLGLVPDGGIALQKWFREQVNEWLIIFDNADHLEDLRGLENHFPQGPCGNIILTSRHAESDSWGYCINVGPLEKNAAIELLLHGARISNTDMTDADHADASRIVERLEYLALAVDLAGNYIHKYIGRPLINYLKNYEMQIAHFLQYTPNMAVWQYQKPLVTTWELSHRRMSQSSPESAKLLDLLAFLDKNGIDEQIFGWCAEQFKADRVQHHELPDYSPGLYEPYLQSYSFSFLDDLNEDKLDPYSKFSFQLPDYFRGISRLESTRKQGVVNENDRVIELARLGVVEWTWVWSPLSLRRLVEPLVDLSLIRMKEGNKDNRRAYFMHPLIQEWIIWRMSPPQRRINADAAARILGNALSLSVSSNEEMSKNPVLTLNPHIMSVLQHIGEEDKVDEYDLGRFWRNYFDHWKQLAQLWVGAREVAPLRKTLSPWRDDKNIPELERHIGTLARPVSQPSHSEAGPSFPRMHDQGLLSPMPSSRPGAVPGV